MNSFQEVIACNVHKMQIKFVIPRNKKPRQMECDDNNQLIMQELGEPYSKI